MAGDRNRTRRATAGRAPDPGLARALHVLDAIKAFTSCTCGADRVIFREGRMPFVDHGPSCPIGQAQVQP